MSAAAVITAADYGAVEQRVVAQILEHHQLFLQNRDAAADHARRVGELLLQVKASLAHGSWLPWLAQHTCFSDRTAARYMRAAAPRPLPVKFDRPSNFKFAATENSPQFERRRTRLKERRFRDELIGHAVLLVGGA